MKPDPDLRITVVADYQERPSEGINVVSKTLIDDLRAAGNQVKVIPPGGLLRLLLSLLLNRAALTVFTHGPGVRTVLISRILRLLSPTRIVWVTTRPDVKRCPGWLTGHRTAHVVICNRARPDLAGVAKGASVVEQPIGIAPERLQSATQNRLWPDLRDRGVPIAVHVGHLRRNRGLDHLIRAKRRLGDRIEIIVQASPTFEPDAGLSEELTEAGIHVFRDFVATIADVYRSADLYLFPAPPDQEGAIELPLSVLEAVACGTPVVTTEFGVLPVVMARTQGVHFCAPQDFTQTIADVIETGLTERPSGLPDRLNLHLLADRFSELTGQVA